MATQRSFFRGPNPHPTLASRCERHPATIPNARDFFPDGTDERRALAASEKGLVSVDKTPRRRGSIAKRARRGITPGSGEVSRRYLAWNGCCTESFFLTTSDALGSPFTARLMASRVAR